MLGRILAVAPRRAVSSQRELSALVSMLEEFPGLPALRPESARASTPMVSTLSNGAVVVTENGASTSTVTMTFPGAGSGSEGFDQSGAALTNKCMMFRSGSGLSTAVILRNIDADGGATFTSVDRTSATIGFTIAPEKAARLVPLLATDCTFEKWDVRDAKTFAKLEIQVAAQSPQVSLTEGLFAAAYGPQSIMGRPLYSADAGTSAIKSFHERAYGVKGAVLAATGIADHAAFAAACEEGLSEAPVGQGVSAVAAVYMGGESRLHIPGTYFTHVALGMPGPSRSAVANVVKHCMALRGVSAFTSSSLIGVYGTSPASDAGTMFESLKGSLATPSADIIKRAKALAKAEACLGLENGSQALAVAMTKGVLESGSFGGVSAAYDAVSEKDVTDAFVVMQTSNPSLAAVGDLSYVPYHASILA